MADDTERISLFIPKEDAQAMRLLRGEGKIKSSSAFISEAIKEKLGKADDKGPADELVELFKGLNDTGQAWLLQCAKVAASSDDMRIIKSRKRNN